MAVNNLEKLSEYYKNGRLAHAYLIETNNKALCLENLKNVFKIMVCQGEYKKQCNECNFCHMIDNQEFPGFYFVNTEGNVIKKEQILDLKHQMSFKPYFTDFCLYVIKDSEKLNSSSTNALLKFLEEPVDNCYGFLLVDSKENVLSTLKSRCEILVDNYEIEDIFMSLNIDFQNVDTYKQIAYQYITMLEQKSDMLIIENKSLILDKISEKKEVEKIFKLILFIYNNAYDNVLGIKNSMFDLNYNFLLEKNAGYLLKKIGILIDFINNFNYNLNIELMLDKFVIEMGEVYE